MEVILTPTAVPDKFGLGLNGFAGSVPGPPTQLSEQWFDSVQMEIVNVIIGQGIALDGLVFDQMKQALDDYSFVDPHVTSTLTVDGGAMILVQSLGTVELLSGSGLVLRNGSTFAVEASVTLVASDNTWVWGSGDANDWTINGDVTLGTSDVTQINLVGDVDIGFDAGSTGFIRGAYALDGASSISGGVGSLLDAETVAADLLALTSTASPSTATGVVTFGGRFLAVGISSVAKRVAIFEDSYSAGPLNTGLAVADTGASVTLVLAIGDKVMISASMQSSNSIGGNHVRAYITVNGVNVGSTIDLLPPAAGEPITIPKHVEYTAAAAIAYTFKLRHGAPDGGTTTTHDAYISVRHKH